MYNDPETCQRESPINYSQDWMRRPFTTFELAKTHFDDCVPITRFPLTEKLVKSIQDTYGRPKSGFSVAVELKLVRKEPTSTQYVINIQK
jgi:hypothetical protein